MHHTVLEYSSLSVCTHFINIQMQDRRRCISPTQTSKSRPKKNMLASLLHLLSLKRFTACSSVLFFMYLVLTLSRPYSSLLHSRFYCHGPLRMFALRLPSRELEGVVGNAEAIASSAREHPLPFNYRKETREVSLTIKYEQSYFGIQTTSWWIECPFI